MRGALTALRAKQAADKPRLGSAYSDHGLVFCDAAGRPRSRQVMNVHLKRATEAAGIGGEWQPRETRHSFVSIASESGVPIEDIADAPGHVNANITRSVYRHVISDTITRAPAAMDQVFAAGGGAGR